MEFVDADIKLNDLDDMDDETPFINEIQHILNDLSSAYEGSFTSEFVDVLKCIVSVLPDVYKSIPSEIPAIVWESSDIEPLIFDALQTIPDVESAVTFIHAIDSLLRTFETEVARSISAQLNDEVDKWFLITPEELRAPFYLFYADILEVDPSQFGKIYALFDIEVLLKNIQDHTDNLGIACISCIWSFCQTCENAVWIELLKALCRLINDMCPDVWIAGMIEDINNAFYHLLKKWDKWRHLVNKEIEESIQERIIPKLWDEVNTFECISHSALFALSEITVHEPEFMTFQIEIVKKVINHYPSNELRVCLALLRNMPDSVIAKIRKDELVHSLIKRTSRASFGEKASILKGLQTLVLNSTCDQLELFFQVGVLQFIGEYMSLNNTSSCINAALSIISNLLNFSQILDSVGVLIEKLWQTKCLQWLINLSSLEHREGYTPILEILQTLNEFSGE